MQLIITDKSKNYPQIEEGTKERLSNTLDHERIKSFSMKAEQVRHKTNGSRLPKKLKSLSNSVSITASPVHSRNTAKLAIPAAAPYLKIDADTNTS